MKTFFLIFLYIIKRFIFLTLPLSGSSKGLFLFDDSKTTGKFSWYSLLISEANSKSSFVIDKKYFFLNSVIVINEHLANSFKSFGFNHNFLLPVLIMIQFSFK